MTFSSDAFDRRHTSPAPSSPKVRLRYRRLTQSEARQRTLALQARPRTVAVVELIRWRAQSLANGTHPGTINRTLAMLRSALPHSANKGRLLIRKGQRHG